MRLLVCSWPEGKRKTVTCPAIVGSAWAGLAADSVGTKACIEPLFERIPGMWRFEFFL